MVPWSMTTTRRGRLARFIFKSIDLSLRPFPLISLPTIIMVSCTSVASYGAVLPLKAFLQEEPLERSQCPSPSSSLDDITEGQIANPLIWAVADRLVLSLLLDSQQQHALAGYEDDEDDFYLADEESEDYYFLDSNLPKPIPVHPARVYSLVSTTMTPAAAAAVNEEASKTTLPRSQSAVF
jgi:hypothetical protein